MSLTPGLNLPFGIQPVNPVPVDSWSGPYSGLTEGAALATANSAITSAIRFQTMEVRVVVAGVGKKFWYRDGILDGNLVEFVSGSGTNGNFLPISGGTLTGTTFAPSFSATSISATTFYSGSTDLSLLFGGTSTGQTIGTGATSVFKQVSGSTFQFRSLTTTGNTQLHTNTGDTITVSSSFGVKNIVLSSETITVDVDYQYLVYGDLTLYGNFFNYGQVVIINGALVLSGGTFTNNGSLLMPSLITGSKYTALFSATANTPFNITHNMGTVKLLYSTWDSSGNEIEIQLTKINTNTVQIVTTSNIINAEIDIIGL